MANVMEDENNMCIVEVENVHEDYASDGIYANIIDIGLFVQFTLVYICS